MADSKANSSNQVPFIPLSPPKCEVDDTPLHGKCLNKNKESLKVKLMLRRPRQDLISRGVIPAVSTSYSFYEQRQRLDMAKKHDILKHKMQRRPQREELVRQHILEDSPNNMDPSLVEKQKQLKRAKIADTISDHLCQRPGPLELVKANILHTSEDLEKAVKEGQLQFKSTSEGETRKHPSFYINPEDESSSEGAFSPDQSEGESGRASRESSVAPITISTVCPSTNIQFSSIQSPASVSSLIFSAAPSVASTVTILPSCRDVTAASPLTSNSSSMSPLSSLTSPPQVIQSPQHTSLAQALLVTQTPLPQALISPPQQNSAPGKESSKSRKKSKGKSQPKARTIKFHEYKGPPTAAKKDATPAETSYDILLQQQQLFLQCQLELKQKYPQIILPADMKPTSSEAGMTLSSVLSLAQSANAQAAATNTVPPPPPPPPPSRSSLIRLPVKLEEMKVSDLKAELKKRNLPVSGSKPSLIERLKSSNKSSLQSTATPKISFSCGSNISAPRTPERSNDSKVDSDTSGNTLGSRSSIDFTDDSSVSGMLEASMEIGDESIASPAYSQISTRPSSVAPMDVDFDSAMDVGGPLTPMASVTSFSAAMSEGSINTPPLLTQSPASNNPTDTQRDISQFLIPVEAPQAADEGIVQLQQKINDLQRKLHDTQMQLQLQQHQNLVKAKELYKQNANDTRKLSTRDILQNQLDSRKQLHHQKQLQNHMQQLQNLQKEQKELVKTAVEESNGLEELLILHPQSVTPVQQSPQQKLHTIITEHPQEGQQITIRPQDHRFVRIADVQVKVEDNWARTVPATTSIPVKSSRSSSVAAPNAQYIINAHNRTSSLPNFSGLANTNQVYTTDQIRDLNSINNNVECFQQPAVLSSNVATASNGIVKPPPNYNEATRMYKNQSTAYRKPSFKSQQVDDVLEILIKSGELPASAAEDPITPDCEMMNEQVPIPPPPPPPKVQRPSSHQQVNAIASPSVFADLVQNSPANMDLSLDFDLPVLGGIELNSLDNHMPGKMPQLTPSVKMEVEDLDVASWIDSLTRNVTSSASGSNWIPMDQASASATPALSNGIRSCSSACSSSSSSGYGSNFHQSDPLLGSNSDQLEYFSIDDIDLKTPNQTSDLSWDRLDFST